MKMESPPVKAWFAGILGIVVSGFGCSDSGPDAADDVGTGGAAAADGTGGSGLPGTGGIPNTGGHLATGGTVENGATLPATGGSTGTSVTPGAGGTAVGAGGSTTGGSSTGGPPPTTGGSAPTTGGSATGGFASTTGGFASTTGGSGTAEAGTPGTETGGVSEGGSSTGGASTATPGLGGRSGGGASAGGANTAGTDTGGADAGGNTGTGGEFTGSCNASQATNSRASGSGPHEVVIETNSDPGIACGTIYRPADLGGGEKYPILVWGEGGCSQDGLSNQAAMGEIASWGYFIVADGTPGGNGSCQGGQDGAQFLDYVTWAIAENEKPCSAYYQSLETTKIAADGFSCGGLMSESVSGDPRFAAIGITSSGQFNSNPSLYDAVHTPFKIMNGGPDDMAYENGLRDYEEISSRGIPIVYFSQTSAGHGGDLFQARGNFNLVNLAWLNWQLKGDEGSTGKGFLYGATCEFCTDGGWVYKSANIE